MGTVVFGGAVIRHRPRGRQGCTLLPRMIAPAPGGEPLWRVSDEPAIFVPALHPAKECRNGRLPRITQRDAAL